MKPRIDYQPAMPAERDALTQRLAQGSLTKVAAAYPEPFWREQGLNGSVWPNTSSRFSIPTGCCRR